MRRMECLQLKISGENEMGRRGIQIKAPVTLSTKGCLRLSEKLLPKDHQDKLSFYVKADPMKKKLELEPSNGNGNGQWPKRRAAFSNKSAKSPTVSVRSALRFIGVPLPKKLTECIVRMKKDGTIVIQF